MPLPIPEGLFEDAEGNVLDDSIPAQFKCPISHSLMTQPTLVTSTGQSFERENITRWVQEHHNDPTSPMQTLNVNDLVPNTALRGLIEEYVGLAVAKRIQDSTKAAKGA